MNSGDTQSSQGSSASSVEEVACVFNDSYEHCSIFGEMMTTSKPAFQKN
jgi:hypothetical protein